MPTRNSTALTTFTIEPEPNVSCITSMLTAGTASSSRSRGAIRVRSSNQVLAKSQNNPGVDPAASENHKPFEVGRSDQPAVTTT